MNLAVKLPHPSQLDHILVMTVSANTRSPRLLIRQSRLPPLMTFKGLARVERSYRPRNGEAGQDRILGRPPSNLGPAPH